MSLDFEDGKTDIIKDVIKIPRVTLMKRKGIENKLKIAKNSIPAFFTLANAVKNGRSVTTIIQED
jgi:hypothetical protein